MATPSPSLGRYVDPVERLLKLQELDAFPIPDDAAADCDEDLVDWTTRPPALHACSSPAVEAPAPPLELPRIVELPDCGDDIVLKPRDADALADARDEAEARAFNSIRPWAGNMMPPSNFDPTTVDYSAPAYELKMDHVYGYRAHGARDNLHWVDEPTTFLYHAASVAVVYNWVERTQTVFNGHTDDITCMAYSRERRLAATGGLGKNNTAPIFVWNVDTMKTLNVLKGKLEFNVCAVAFSACGSRIMGLGSDNYHTVALYDVASGALLASANGDSNRILHLVPNTTESADPKKNFISIGVSHIKFWTKTKEQLTGKKAIGGNISKQTMLSVTCTPKLVVVGNVSGQIYLFSEGTLVKTIRVHDEFVGALACEGTTLYTGGRDGFLRRFAVDEEAFALKEEFKHELNTLNVLSNRVAQQRKIAQESGVFRPPNAVEKGKKLFNGPRALDVMNGKIVVGTNLASMYVATSDFEVHTIMDSHFEDVPGSMPEMWGLDRHPTEPLFATTSEDCTVRLWSVELGSMVLMANVFYKGRSVCFSPDGNTLVVGHENGAFSAWDAMTLTPQLGFTRKREHCVNACGYSPDGRFLALGMGLSHVVDIYDAKRGYQFIACCDALAGSVMHLDWSVGSTMLRCSTASYEVIHFNLPTCEMNQSLDIADELWATQRCIIGWGVQGIWDGCNDGTDVNCVARSACGTLLAVGYDMTTVRLYNYPCLPRQAQRTTRLTYPAHYEYIGHSSHVTGAVFTSDNRFLITIGGMDLTAIRWRIVPVEGAKHSKKPADVAEETLDQDETGAAGVAASIAAGKIHELAPEPKLSQAERLSRSMRLTQRFGGSTSNNTTFRRPGSGNHRVESRLLHLTASTLEKARVAQAQREHLERQQSAKSRFKNFGRVTRSPPR